MQDTRDTPDTCANLYWRPDYITTKYFTLYRKGYPMPVNLPEYPRIIDEMNEPNANDGTTSLIQVLRIGCVRGAPHCKLSHTS